MAILVFSPNGTHVTKPTLEVARTSADCVGKTVVVTSALTAAQSDITAAWPTDRALEVKKGGSIGNTLAFTISGSFSAGVYRVFAGTGGVVLPLESRPEWFGTGDNSATIQAAINSLPNGGKVLLSPKRYTITTSLVPVAYAGNTGFMKTMKLVGSGSSRGMNDLAGLNNYGTTLYVAVNVPNNPVVSLLSGSRGVELKDLNIVGQGGTVPLTDNSVAVEMVDATEYLLLDNVSIYGFDVGLKITGNSNNDFTTIRGCNFDFLNNVILNYSINAYGVYMTDSSVGVYTNILYRAIADAQGQVNPSFKAYRNFIGSAVGVVYIYSTTAAISSLGVISLIGNTIEGNSSPITSCYLFSMTSTSANNALDIHIADNEINGALSLATHYSTTWALVKYAGRGGFVFENNNVTGYGRPVFNISMVNSSNYGGGGRIANNSFTNRYAVIYPAGEEYPALEEYNNFSINYTANSVDTGAVLLPVNDQQYKMYAGKINASVGNVDTIPATPYRKGSNWNYIEGATVTENRVKVEGTIGTITGVTATVANAATTATLVGGTAAQKALVFINSKIQIGASGVLDVQNVVGDTVYLRSTYGGVTQTALAVSYFTPIINRVQHFGTDPTGLKAGAVGDRVINGAPGSAQPKAWSCTAAGSPATWLSEGNL